MYKRNKLLAIIPARGGSKGIPRKNVVKVSGKPLIQYTIDAAKASKYLDTIIVSTEDQEIADISIKLGAEVPFLRPKHLASDHAKTIDALMFTIEKLRDDGLTYDYVVTLQPTQPLRQSWHIDEAIEKVIDQAAENLVSISEVTDHPILMRTISEDGNLKNVLNTNSTVRRQDFPHYYKVNGAIYINKLSTLSHETSLNDNKLGYKMDRKFDLDIDSPKELSYLKYILEKQDFRKGE